MRKGSKPKATCHLHTPFSMFPSSLPQERRGFGVAIVESLEEKLGPGGDEDREGEVVEEGDHSHHHLGKKRMLDRGIEE